MEKVMGKNGIVLWKKAQGIDNSLVEPYSERKSMSSSLTFEKDTIVITSYSIHYTKLYDEISSGCRVENKGLVGTCSCCGSEFVFVGGSVSKGPAAAPLKQYTSYNFV